MDCFHLFTVLNSKRFMFFYQSNTAGDITASTALEAFYVKGYMLVISAKIRPLFSFRIIKFVL